MSWELKPGQIAIVIEPELNDKDEWDGVLKTGLVFGEEQHEDAMKAAMDLALTMASSSAVLEEYPELYDYFDDARHVILQDMFPDQYEASKLAVQKDKEYTQEGNVIKLTKWTKTLGEA